MDALLLLALGAGAYLYINRSKKSAPSTSIPFYIPSTSPSVSAGSPNSAGPGINMPMPVSIAPNVTSPLLPPMNEREIPSIPEYTLGDPYTQVGGGTVYPTLRDGVPTGGHIYEKQIPEWMQYHETLSAEQQAFIEHLQAVLADEALRAMRPDIYVPLSEMSFGPENNRTPIDDPIENFIDLIPPGLAGSGYDTVLNWLTKSYASGLTKSELLFGLQNQIYAQGLMVAIGSYGEEAYSNLGEEYTRQVPEEVARVQLERGTYRQGGVGTVAIFPGDQIPINTNHIKITGVGVGRPPILYYTLGTAVQGRTFYPEKITAEQLSALREIGIDI